MVPRLDSTDVEERRTGVSLGRLELQELFTEMRDEISRFLRRRLGDEHLAADLTHDIFVKLASIQPAIEDRRRGRSYLLRMAKNLAIDHRKVEARRLEILSGAQVLFEDVEQGPDVVAVSRDELRQVDTALSELPERCGEVLFLSQAKGLNDMEIAERLGVSSSLVEKARLRALRHCRERLSSIRSSCCD